MTAKELAVHKPKDHAVAVAAPSTANAIMSLIERAVLDPAFSVEKMDALLAVKERLDKEEARKAYAVALAEFKAEVPAVMKRKQVKFSTNSGTTEYKHATLGDACAILSPHLSKFGLSHSWDMVQKDGKIAVTCVLTHALGHSHSVTLEAAYDQSGGKNAIQSVVSAKSYLERHTFFAVTGTASQDMADDDDGKSAGAPIPGPKEKKAPEISGGKDTFVIAAGFLVGKSPKIELRGPNPDQRYRIDEAVAKTAKANFAPGDTAIVEWAIKDGVKTVTDLERKAAAAEKEF